ncbi:MAG TPA: RidA family protein [Arthrobacter sp.]|nr:RidA family protein [Arthrobacter sp.]
MRVRQAFNVPGVPAPVAYKSMATVWNGTAFVSGQIGKGPDGQPIADVRGQVEQAFRQIGAILEGVGSSLDMVLLMGVYVTDIGTLSIVSDVRRKFIPSDPPASFGVEVAQIALGAAVELQVVAAVPEGST